MSYLIRSIFLLSFLIISISANTIHRVAVLPVEALGNHRFKVPVIALRNAQQRIGTIYRIHPVTLRVQAVSITVEKIEGQNLIVRTKENLKDARIVVAGFDGLHQGMHVISEIPKVIGN